jgi:hypothetical protein
MAQSFHRTCISAVAGLSILITGLAAAAPARADSDDVARALAAIVGIAIIGAAINDARDDDRVKPVTRHKPYVAPRPLPRRINRKLLPEHCFRVLSDRRGAQVPAFGRRCLNRNYSAVSSLPRNCLRQAYGHNGLQYAYGARCLRGHGYQLARR